MQLKIVAHCVHLRYDFDKGRSINNESKGKTGSKIIKKTKDFTYDEMAALLSYFGYDLKQGGSGSGVKFIKVGSNEVINFHRPHPTGILKRYVLDQVIEKLRKDGFV